MAEVEGATNGVRWQGAIADEGLLPTLPTPEGDEMETGVGCRCSTEEAKIFSSTVST